MSKPAQRAEELFAGAMKIADGEARRAHLDQACGSDAALRMEVESLLAAHFAAGDFLGRTMALPQGAVMTEKPGTRIGRYKLLEKIGEGGFGVVYMAEQEEPVRRRVALKITKLGMDTKEVVARFEAERQALAMMDHPNIASVFDGGATGTGRPYFVMELVKGVPITEYCDATKLSTRERLELFMQVCHAVQHAHQKGVIHRDLKPNNILVTVKDDRPVPKVIDFGVAKATQMRLTEKTMFTRLNLCIGTPAYMSPEQAGLGSLDVDTRSDVYSLGVLLYELLTGRPPFDTQKLFENGYDAVMRTIREEEPPKPSTRLSSLNREELGTVAAKRSAEPAKLNRLVHGDLDWIVMKALDKDRRRRYETPDALASDVARHQSNEPVLASPPSLPYLVTKFVRRHKAGLATASALVLLLAAGVVVSTWQAVLARQQAQLAEDRRREAEASWLAATDAQNRAVRSAKEVSHQLAREYVDKGVQRLDEGDSFGSLVWFTEALRLDAGNSASEALHRLRIGVVLAQRPKVIQVFLHRGGVTSVEFSTDGQRLVTAGSDRTARAWDLKTGALLARPMEHTDAVVSASFSPDGQRIVTGSFDHTARVWDANSGAPITPPLHHSSNVLSAAFSPNGQRVVTASMDNTARVWDATTGQPVTPPLRHEDVVWPAAFSPDGRFVVTASQDKTARIWDAETGKPVTPALQHAGKVWWATFSPDGLLVATASEDHTARIWNAQTGMPVTPPLQHSEEVISVAFSPEGKRVVTASGESIFGILEWKFKDRPGEARVWDATTGKPLTQPMQHKLGVFWAVFSPDGRFVATASRDKTARVWDATTGKPLTAPLPHREDVFRVAFTQDGRRLATASFDSAARIWEISDERPPIDLRESWLAGEFSFSSDGQRVAGKYIGGSARIWNAITGIPTTPQLHDTNLHHVALSADGRSLATAGADNAARLWDADTGAALTPPLQHEAEIFWIAFSPDDQRVVTASADKTARIWNAATGAPTTSPIQHASNVLCAAFSPDGRRVVTASEDKTARVWDSYTGTAVTPPLLHNDGVQLAVFSADSGRLVTATWDGVTRVWDANTGAAITPPMKQAGRFMMARGIVSMSFSPDGQRIVVANGDGTARIWDANKGTPITPPLQHGDAVNYAAFSHNGRYVVTTSSDKTARVWDAATGQPITPPLKHKGPVDGAMFSADDRELKTVGHGENGGFIVTWELKPDDRPTKELLVLAEMLSLHRLDATGTFCPLDFGVMTNVSWSERPQ